MCFFVHGVCRPETGIAGDIDAVVAESPGGVVEVEDEVKSDIVRSLIPGRPRSRCPGCWARSASVACFINVDEDSERCNISSDKLRFLSIGFFEPKQSQFDNGFGGVMVCESRGREVPVCNGPYNHVVSLSLSLFFD